MDNYCHRRSDSVYIGIDFQIADFIKLFRHLNIYLISEYQ